MRALWVFANLTEGGFRPEMMAVDYPLTFEVSGTSEHHTHSGVYEFTAEEGQCYMPYWVRPRNGLCFGGSS
jgi:hypothetical protein